MYTNLTSYFGELFRGVKKPKYALWAHSENEDETIQKSGQNYNQNKNVLPVLLIEVAF